MLGAAAVLRTATVRRSFPQIISQSVQRAAVATVTANAAAVCGIDSHSFCRRSSSAAQSVGASVHTLTLQKPRNDFAAQISSLSFRSALKSRNYSVARMLSRTSCGRVAAGWLGAKGLASKASADSVSSEQDNAAEQASSSVIKPKLRVHHILASKSRKNFTVPHTATVKQALNHLVKERISSALTVNTKGEVMGIFTARDMLTYVNNNYITADPSSSDALQRPISVMSTTRDKLVYCSPTDSVRRCREIMFQCKIRNMPVIESGEAKGIITMKDLADSAFSVADTGGKKGFIHNVTGRRGLPVGTRIDQNSLQGDEGPGSQASHSPSHAQPMDLVVGVYSLPHPFKNANGVAPNRRQYGTDPLCTDHNLTEDAHFALRVQPKDLGNVGEHSVSIDSDSSDSEKALVLDLDNSDASSADDSMKKLAANSSGGLVYLCLADGVGSWRMYDVDPREYSHRLVERAKEVVEADAMHRKIMEQSPFTVDQQPVHPLDIILDAWNMNTADGVVGSTTICVAMLDKKLNQLSYSNIGKDFYYL